MSGCKWIKQEDEFLIKNYDVLSQSKIAEALNRSKSTICYRIKMLGLHKHNCGDNYKPVKKLNCGNGINRVYDYSLKELDLQKANKRKIMFNNLKIGDKLILSQMNKIIIEKRKPVASYSEKFIATIFHRNDNAIFCKKDDCEIISFNLSDVITKEVLIHKLPSEVSNG